MIFMEKFWTLLFILVGTQLLHSSSFNLQTDGQMECINSLLEDYFRHYMRDNQENWSNLLDVAQFSYNL